MKGKFCLKGLFYDLSHNWSEWWVDLTWHDQKEHIVIDSDIYTDNGTDLLI